MNKSVFGLIPLLMGITFAGATPDDSPCGIVTKSAKGVQVIPAQGRVQTKLAVDSAITCGSMLITHEESFWLKLADQTTLKLGPHTFVEIPLKNQNYRIYRGRLLISAPPGIRTQVWSTPNSETLFQGGVAFIHYSNEERETTAASFNRSFEFRNKFNPSAMQAVRAGEMSSLLIQDAEVNPTVPAVMDPSSVTETLADLQLEASDQKELVAITKRVYDTRAQALASEISDWDENEKTATRSVASIEPTQSLPSKSKKSVPAINPVEANFVAVHLRSRLYGNEEDRQTLKTSRKPASVQAHSAIADPELAKQKAKSRQATFKLEKEIENIHSD